MFGKQIARSQKGRKCKTPDCNNILSVYNHDVYCHADLNKRMKMPAYAGPDPDKRFGDKLE